MEHDEEFAAFLKTFRLRQSNPPRALGSAQRHRVSSWIVVGAAVAASTAAVFFGVLAGRYSVHEQPHSAPLAPPAIEETAPKPQLQPEQSVQPRPSTKKAPKKPLAAAVVPQDPGKGIFEKVCSPCHSLTVSQTLHLVSRTEYEKYISDKRSKGVMILDAELPVLADYMFKNFGKK